MTFDYIGNQMVTNQLDLTFGALSDATRRAILETLSEGDSTVGELAAPFDMSRPAISKHLRVLERASLVRRTRDGRFSRCGPDATPLGDAADWVDDYRKFWEGRLDSLTHFLEKEQPGKERKKK